MKATSLSPTAWFSVPHKGPQLQAPDAGDTGLPTLLAEHRIIGPSCTDDVENRLPVLHIGGGGEAPAPMSMLRSAGRTRRASRPHRHAPRLSRRTHRQGSHMS